MKKNTDGRRKFLKKSSLGLTGFSVAAWPAINNNDQKPTPDFLQLLTLAGNAREEKERYRLLQAASEQPDVDEETSRHLQELLKIAGLWANGRENAHLYHPETGPGEDGYLCGFFFRKSNLKDYVVPKVPENSPLYPLCCLYRGRMLIWSAIQNAKIRPGFQEEGIRLLKIAREAYPHNPVIGMYLNEPIPWSAAIDNDEKAPRWASLQRETLEKLTDLIHWWIDHRQLPNGSYGGGWGDDCEMWRLWTPVLLGFQDDKMERAQARLSNGMFSLDRMKGGYTSIMSDVEHTAEDTADTITPMMHIAPESPTWKNRALRLAELMKEKWAGTNQRGFLQFKSTYFTSETVDLQPSHACDTVYHPRAVQPALLYWQRTGDKDLEKLFTAWMKTWVDAAERSERGKPAGILPSALHWPSGRVGGIGKEWWRPENYGTDLYNWPSTISMLNNTLLLCYHMTGDDLYLKPLQSMAAIRRKYAGDSSIKTAPEGSIQWCANQIGSFLPDSLAKYRWLTGDTQFDDLLKADADGYMRFVLTGSESALLEGFGNNEEALRYNFESFTSETRFTDRVLRFANGYLIKHFDASLPTFDASFLYTTLTGDYGSPLYFPLNAVRWLTHSKDMAALVKVNKKDQFKADLYHFGLYPRDMGAECYMLSDGKYQLEITQGSDVVQKTEVTIDGQKNQVLFQLPSKQLCTLSLKK